MADNAGGYLEVGHNERGEVVVNLPPGQTGHIVFSTAQARAFAALLRERADALDLGAALARDRQSASTAPHDGVPMMACDTCDRAHPVAEGVDTCTTSQPMFQYHDGRPEPLDLL